MIKARFTKANTLESLREEVPQNLERYRASDSFSELIHDPSLYFEINLNIEETAFQNLHAPTEEELFEVENCSIIFDALSNLDSL